MTNLKTEVDALRAFFDPTKSKPHGPFIWVPKEDDPNGQFKSIAAEKAQDIILAGENALASQDFEVPSFGESELNAITENLSSDPEEQAYYELALACQRVVLSLSRFAA